MAISFPEYYFLLPLVGVLLSFIIPQQHLQKVALLVASISLLLGIISLAYVKLGVHHPLNHANYIWLDSLGSLLELKLDGTSALLCLLTSCSILAAIAISPAQITNSHFYYALIFFLQIGLNGVFLSYDVFCFYLFWEVVLIPTYFLCSYYGGPKALQPTLKFFLYTFIGSLFMLFGIIYLYTINPAQSFTWESLKSIPLTTQEQTLLFFLFMIAFVVKMPLFPFHTWQAKLYSNSPVAITLILSSVMVKMGLIGVVRWVLPFFPLAIGSYSIYIVALAVIGILYAALIALRQQDLKLLLAYSSLGHIGLMGAALLTQKSVAIQGVLLQMFNHGINVLGLWLLISIFERKYKTTNTQELGGVIKNAPFLGTLFLLFSFANIALPLTNSFVGEMPILFGLFQYNKVIGIVATSSVVFSAVYMLRAVDATLFGKDTALVINPDYKTNKTTTFLFLLLLLFVFSVGVYSKVFFELIKNTMSFL